MWDIKKSATLHKKIYITNKKEESFLFSKLLYYLYNYSISLIFYVELDL